MKGLPAYRVERIIIVKPWYVLIFIVFIAISSSSSSSSSSSISIVLSVSAVIAVGATVNFHTENCRTKNLWVNIPKSLR